MAIIYESKVHVCARNITRISAVVVNTAPQLALSFC